MVFRYFHIAGEPGGLTQKCERCGVVIVDCEDAMIAGKDARPMFFPAHRIVEHAGNSWIGGSQGVTDSEFRHGLCDLPRQRRAGENAAAALV